MPIAKILLDTLRTVDGGRVECEVSTPEGGISKAMIENSFFEDFMGAAQPNLSLQRQNRIVRENLDYLEREVERLWQMGSRELVIR